MLGRPRGEAGATSWSEGPPSGVDERFIKMLTFERNYITVN